VLGLGAEGGLAGPVAPPTPRAPHPPKRIAMGQRGSCSPVARHCSKPFNHYPRVTFLFWAGRGYKNKYFCQTAIHKKHVRPKEAKLFGPPRGQNAPQTRKNKKPREASNRPKRPQNAPNRKRGFNKHVGPRGLKKIQIVRREGNVVLR
jgi:hypothetical protein